MISARIIADSINPLGKRLTSWILTYPRFIHAEFMTHRVFSRNAASSRAIPLAKMISDIEEEPALPEFWAKEHKGMQAASEMNAAEIYEGGVKKLWDHAKYDAIAKARTLSKAGLAKSLCNRLLEPFSHITVLATAQDHRNFFALRAHSAAMPEFQVLAYRMLHQYFTQQPQKLEWGQWHIPHFQNEAGIAWDTGLSGDDAIKIATARCARLSYLTFDGDHDPSKDIELHDRLLASGHMSPFEHCAEAVGIHQSDRIYHYSNFDHQPPYMSGWQQYRKQFDNENLTEVHLGDILESKPEWITL